MLPIFPLRAYLMGIVPMTVNSSQEFHLQQQDAKGKDLD
jgi:hypothetical protein